MCCICRIRICVQTDQAQFITNSYNECLVSAAEHINFNQNQHIQNQNSVKKSVNIKKK